MQSGTGTGVVMPLPFRIRVIHVSSSNIYGASLWKPLFEKCTLTLVNGKTVQMIQIELTRQIHIE